MSVQEVTLGELQLKAVLNAVEGSHQQLTTTDVVSATIMLSVICTTVFALGYLVRDYRISRH